MKKCYSKVRRLHQLDKVAKKILNAGVTETSGSQLQILWPENHYSWTTPSKKLRKAEEKLNECLSRQRKTFSQCTFTV